MILPFFGAISEILPIHARKPIFGYKAIAFSSLAISFLGLMSGRTICLPVVSLVGYGCFL